MGLDERAAYLIVSGKVIALLRQRAGLTQGELAAKAGITQSGLSRIEAGHAALEAYTQRSIAQALGLAPEDLQRYIDQAYDRTEKTATSAMGERPRDPSPPWWQSALAVAGAVGLAGLAAFAVAAVLTGEENDDDDA